jgi:hypothetical protein
MAFTSLGPEEFDDPELPLPVFPELPEFPKDPPPLKGEPLPKGLLEEPERPEDPELEGRRELPEVGLKAWVVLPLFDVAWPMPKPAPRTAIAAAPARSPLRSL